MIHDGGYWRKSYGTSTAASDDTSSGLVYVISAGYVPSNYGRSDEDFYREPHSNRRPEWWKPPQSKREKRPLSVRVWQSARRAAKKLARTNERRERRSRA